MHRAKELGKSLTVRRAERGNRTIPWNMMTGQRSGLLHLWLVAGRQPKDTFVYVRLRDAMRKNMSFAYGILKNGMGCTWGGASCLEGQEGSLETILDPGSVLEVAVRLLEGRNGVITPERCFHFGKN